ncbi:MAG: hypothetical protein C0596_09570 [Marinilabiliales bacterium]|nr:MAG: hypothetical protein C0596_09570 [Marinilabiliales bacterium]
MQTEGDILILLFLGIAAIIILALAIVTFVIQYHKRGIKNKLEIEQLKTKQQAELINKISIIQEAERSRISSNLHDEVGSSLSAINYMIGHIRLKSDGEIKEIAENAELNLRNTMDEISNIVQNISPAIVQKFGIYKAAREICERVNKLNKVAVILEIEREKEIDNKTIELKLYRIFQELFNNSFKNSKASKIEVNIKYSDIQFVIEVIDNGIGIDLEKANQSKSLGVDNIRTQVKYLEGQFLLENIKEGGTRAYVSIPSEKLLFLQSEQS